MTKVWVIGKMLVLRKYSVTLARGFLKTRRMRGSPALNEGAIFGGISA
jgi:hypothetical protein